MYKKYALVCGAGGFIGSHLVKDLKKQGFWVRGVDLKYPEYDETAADDFIIGDLRDPSVASRVMFSPTQVSLEDKDHSFDEVYQLAADMGGAGFVFTGDNDAVIMHNSALININILEAGRTCNIKKIFYSSSACIYPEFNQMNPDDPKTAEDSAYPANPDSEYGWEKLFSERLYLAFNRNYGMDVRIVRFHNIFGPLGSWNNGREKAPAAMCRKVAETDDGGTIEMWGEGKQTRSFLYIDECLVAMRKFMNQDKFIGPINIGSEEMITINRLAEMVMEIADKKQTIKHIPGPLGVMGRNSDNKLIKEILSWAPDYPLKKGLALTYKWIEGQINKKGL